MKNTINKRILALLLALLLTFAVFPAVGSLPKASAAGYCGSNVWWQLDEATGTLSLSGYGSMYYYYSASGTPWANVADKIKAVEIGNGITEIGSYAFSACQRMLTVSIPSSVSYIGDRAFFNCIRLTELSLQSNPLTLGAYAFASCISLSSVSIGYGLTAVSDYAFYDCKKLTEIVLPATVTELGPSAFASCPALSSVQLPSSLKTIGDAAFSSCTVLTGVVIPSGVTSVGKFAFASCPALTELTFPASVTSIGNAATIYCSGISNITVYNRECEIFLSSNTFPTNAVIRGVTDSTAFLYANKYSRSFFDLCTYGHTYGEWVTESAASCYAEGSRQRTCKLCGYTENGSISKTAHSFSSAWTTDAAPSCTGYGSKSRHCTVCSARTDVTSIPPTGHSLTSVKTAASFTTAGRIDSKCTVCGRTVSSQSVAKVSTAKLEKTEFTYSGKAVTVVPVLKDANGKALRSGTDYTVNYKDDHTNPGQKSVVISLKGNYSGTKTLTYKINPGKVSCIERTSDSKSAFILSWSPVKNATFYEIYMTSGSSYSKVASVSGTSYTRSSAPSYKKVKIRAVMTVNGTNFFGEYSDVLDVTSSYATTHVFGSKWYTEKAATCVDPGVKYQICTVCGAHAHKTTATSSSHTYGSWVTTKKATCKAEGIRTKTCKLCGNKKTEKIAKSGHSYSSSWTVDKKPTCTAAGSKSHHCTVCGAKGSVTSVPAAGHKFGSWTTVKKATCTAAGSRKHTCSVCKKTVTETVKQTAHSYSSKWTTDKKATCTAAGSKSHHCTVCGAKGSVTSIPAAGHKYGSWKTVRKATCTASGSRKHTCSVCKKSVTETVKAKGHSFSSKWTTDKKATCTAAGSKSHHCTVCGAKGSVTSIPAAGHKYGSWKTVRKATCTASGSRKHTCSVCKKTVTATVKKTAHSYSSKWTTDKKATCTAAGSKSHHCTVCGAKGSVTTIPKIGSGKLGKTTYEYTGSAVTPKFTVKDSSGKTLKKNTDYTVSYPSGNVSVGKHSVKVTFKGSYSGTRSLSFSIVPGKVTGLKEVTSDEAPFGFSWNRYPGASSYELIFTYPSGDTITKEAKKDVNKLGITFRNPDITVQIRAIVKVGGVEYRGALSDPLPCG